MVELEESLVDLHERGLEERKSLVNQEEKLLRQALRGAAQHNVDSYAENLSAVVGKQIDGLVALQSKLKELQQGLQEELTMSRRGPAAARARGY